MAAEKAGMRWTIQTRSAERTEEIGRVLGECAPAGALLTLDGVVGTGKSCVVRGLARGLGVGERVVSPSFNLHLSYSGRLVLHHFDAYFGARARAFFEQGADEYFSRDEICALEWPGQVLDFLPEDRLQLFLCHLSPSERELAFSARGPRAETWLVAAIARAGERFSQPG